jgi:hypothetical protein
MASETKKRKSNFYSEEEVIAASEAYGPLRSRSVEIRLPRAATPYTAKHLFDTLQSLNIDTTDVAAIGPFRGNRCWQICFKDSDVYNYIISVNSFIVNNMPGEVTPIEDDTIKLRVHWLPCWRPTAEIVWALEKQNIHVVNALDEIYPNTEIKTLTRIVIVKANIEDIPYILKLDDGLDVLITSKSRRPLCLKCKQVGHVSKKCPDHADPVENIEATSEGVTDDAASPDAPRDAAMDSTPTPEKEPANNITPSAEPPSYYIHPIKEKSDEETIGIWKIVKPVYKKCAVWYMNFRYPKTTEKEIISRFMTLPRHNIETIIEASKNCYLKEYPDYVFP